MLTEKATLIDNTRSPKVRTSRLFIAADVPAEVKTQLTERQRQYAGYVKRSVTPDKWHITCQYIGPVEDYEQHIPKLTLDLPQTYLPTITLTHVGRGLQTGQLWAYAKPTALLGSLRQQLQHRVSQQLLGWQPMNQYKEFSPHIKLAELRDQSVSKFVADSPERAVWPIKELFLYQSTVYLGEMRYEVIGAIKL